MRPPKLCRRDDCRPQEAVNPRSDQGQLVAGNIGADSGEIHTFRSVGKVTAEIRE
jgi:hypothetical protein